ncbi:hypothetical protein MUK42_36303 [Musa troglodytarum]|uniref:Uncharacterized protein n=1 Tax=Musa troglodytarum TaxID=320322 RepID=A0A9E7GCT7_9LILI|nr:hypothetical protein MUK42_36303 [Musa troglodytarum]
MVSWWGTRKGAWRSERSGRRGMVWSLAALEGTRREPPMGGRKQEGKAGARLWASRTAAERREARPEVWRGRRRGEESAPGTEALRGRGWGPAPRRSRRAAPTRQLAQRSEGMRRPCPPPEIPQIRCEEAKGGREGLYRGREGESKVREVGLTNPENTTPAPSDGDQRAETSLEYQRGRNHCSCREPSLVHHASDGQEGVSLRGKEAIDRVFGDAVSINREGSGRSGCRLHPGAKPPSKCIGEEGERGTRCPQIQLFVTGCWRFQLLTLAGPYQAIMPLHLNQLKPKHPLRWLFACKKLRNGYILSPTVKATRLLLLRRSLQPAVTDLFGGIDVESQSIITFLLAKLFPGCAKPNPT